MERKATSHPDGASGVEATCRSSRPPGRSLSGDARRITARRRSPALDERRFTGTTDVWLADGK